jgi:hypothetical protein
LATNRSPAAPPRSDSILGATKLAVPITVAVGAIWAVSQLVFGAGSKVSGSEKDIAYLTSKCDALAIQIAETKAAMKEDHDALIEERVKLSSLKEYVDNELASKNVTVTVADADKKK